MYERKTSNCPSGTCTQPIGRAPPAYGVLPSTRSVKEGRQGPVASAEAKPRRAYLPRGRFRSSGPVRRTRRRVVPGGAWEVCRLRHNESDVRIAAAVWTTGPEDPTCSNGIGPPSGSAFHVLGPTMPSTTRPAPCWNCLTALAVAGPNTPSTTSPGSGVRRSARWARRTTSPVAPWRMVGWPAFGMAFPPFPHARGIRALGEAPGERPRVAWRRPHATECTPRQRAPTTCERETFGTPIPHSESGRMKAPSFIRAGTCHGSGIANLFGSGRPASRWCSPGSGRGAPVQSESTPPTARRSGLVRLGQPDPRRREERRLSRSGEARSIDWA